MVSDRNKKRKHSRSKNSDEERLPRRRHRKHKNKQGRSKQSRKTKNKLNSRNRLGSVAEPFTSGFRPDPTGVGYKARKTSSNRTNQPKWRTVLNHSHGNNQKNRLSYNNARGINGRTSDLDNLMSSAAGNKKKKINWGYWLVLFIIIILILVIVYFQFFKSDGSTKALDSINDSNNQISASQSDVSGIFIPSPPVIRDPSHLSKSIRAPSILKKSKISRQILSPLNPISSKIISPLGRTKPIGSNHIKKNFRRTGEVFLFKNN